MRPKKRILLVDHDEYRQSVIRFRLVTHAFAVFSATTAAEARDLFDACMPELVIASFDFPYLAVLLKMLHDARPDIPQMVLAPAKGCNVIADAVLSNPTPEHMLNYVKMMAARKRGPRPVKPVVSDWRAEAEAWAARRLA
jgi:DNA-binding response OmpR family regulator